LRLEHKFELVEPFGQVAFVELRRLHRHGCGWKGLVRAVVEVVCEGSYVIEVSNVVE